MNVAKLDPRAILPRRIHSYDAGYDLFAREDATLQPGDMPTPMRTGIALCIPSGHVGIIKPRSSLGVQGIQVYGGVIDSGYRGEVIVLLGSVQCGQTFRIKAGARIAQLVVARIYTEDILEVSSELLGVTDRGVGGFGSTGR